jgi:hypothetical protein
MRHLRLHSAAIHVQVTRFDENSSVFSLAQYLIQFNLPSIAS